MTDSNTNDTRQSTLSMNPKTRVGHHKKDPVDVYIGRDRRGGELKHLNNTPVGKRGWLGNPFVEDIQDTPYTHDESIEAYREAFHDRIESDAEFRDAIHDFQGGVLGCWCRTLDSSRPSCHGDVIAEYLNSL